MRDNGKQNGTCYFASCWDGLVADDGAKDQRILEGRFLDMGAPQHSLDILFFMFLSIWFSIVSHRLNPESSEFSLALTDFEQSLSTSRGLAALRCSAKLRRSA